MAIINTAPSAPLTQQQILAAQAAAYSAQMNQQYQQMARLFQQVGKFCWANPAPNSAPQAVFDAFGTNAGDLFKLAAAFTALVATYTGTSPTSPVPSDYTYVINNDGTVTVTHVVSDAAKVAAVKPVVAPKPVPPVAKVVAPAPAKKA